MNILITGHSGFIGTYLKKELSNHNLIYSDFRLDNKERSRLISTEATNNLNKLSILGLFNTSHKE